MSIVSPKELYFKIKEQRKTFKAVVDFFGLVAIPKSYPEQEYKFLLLVSVLLSSQTRDENTSQCINNLINNKILSFASLAKLSLEEIKELIKTAGFANKKAQYLFDAAKAYCKKELPNTYKEIISIKGIGNKMAYLYLDYGCGIIDGVAVDTHVLRISQRIGVTKSKNAEICRKALEKIFDKEEWSDINHILVGFGQNICTAINPKCQLCIINKECPSSTIKKDIHW